MKKYFYLIFFIFLSCNHEVIFYDLTVEVMPNKSGNISLPTSQYPANENINITASPYEEYLFSHWSGDIYSEKQNLEFVMKSDLNLIANFKKKKFDLELNIVGEGSVEKEIIKSNSTDSYNINTIVRLLAEPSKYYVFSHWEGDIESNKNPLDLQITKNLKITAVFIKKKYEMELSVELINNFLPHEFYNFPKIKDIEIRIIKQGLFTDYNAGTVLSVFAPEIPPVLDKKVIQNDTLSINPQPPWVFKRWSGTVESLENPIQITVDNNTKLVAVYETANPIYLDENNVTLKAYEWSKPGYTGINGNDTLTIVDKNILVSKIKNKKDISKVVTTKIKSLSNLLKEGFKIDSDGDGKFNSKADSLNMHNEMKHFNVDISSWDVSSVVNFDALFKGFSSFNQDLSQWNLQSALSTKMMFEDAKSFNSDLTYWDVSNVVHMDKMFKGAEKFNGNISDWDVSNVNSMKSMFNDASNFNIDISNWNVNNIINNSNFLANAKSFNQDLSQWCFSKSCVSSDFFAQGSGLSINYYPSWGGCNMQSTKEYAICLLNFSNGVAISGYDKNGFIDKETAHFSTNDLVILNARSKSIDFQLKSEKNLSTDTITKSFMNGSTNKALFYRPSKKGHVKLINAKDESTILNIVIN